MAGPSDHTEGAISGQVNVRIVGSYLTSLMRDFLQYSWSLILFIHIIQFRSSAGKMKRGNREKS